MKFSTATTGIGVVLFIHAILLITESYTKINQIDVLMHFFGGFVVGMMGLAIHSQISKKYFKKGLPLWYTYMFVAGFGTLVGVLWEFHEFFLDQTLSRWYGWGRTQVSLADTMADFLNDWLGTSFAFLFFRKK